MASIKHRILIALIIMLAIFSIPFYRQTVPSSAQKPMPSTPKPSATAQPISIGNLIWNDLNNNGLQDQNEPGLAGIEVQLWNDTKTTMLNASISDTTGHYRLIAPQPGSYRIRVLSPANAQISPKDIGNNNLLDSDTNPSGVDLGFTDVFTITSNIISITHIDIGIIP
jgi:hypothetical protein